MLITPADVGQDCLPIKLYPYTSSSIDVWDILAMCHRDPTTPDNIILIYSQYSVPVPRSGTEHTSRLYNREHISSRSPSVVQ